jgi:hypothetical protein
MQGRTADGDGTSDDDVDDRTPDVDVDVPVAGAGREDPMVTINPGWVADPESWPPDCDSFDPSRVYLYGVIAEGNHGRGTGLDIDHDGTIRFDRFSEIGDPENPTRVCPGFEPLQALTIRPSDGAIITANLPYTYGTDRISPTVRVHRADPFLYHAVAGAFHSPTDSWMNDQVLVTGCPDGTVGDFSLLIKPDSSEVSFSCNGKNYLVPNVETAPGYQVVAHGHDGHMLIRERDVPNDLGILRAGVLTKLDRQWPGRREHAARSRDGGFWLAIQSEGVVQQVSVNYDGTTSVVGNYADAPAPYLNRYDGVLDGQGRLWQIGGSSAIPYALYYRPVAPENSEVVYSADDYDVDMTIKPPRAYVDLQSAKMFTGP